MDKIRDLRELVREIPNGSTIGLGGFIITRCPMAFAAELIRQGKKELVCYSIMGTMEADLLVGAGCAREYSYAGGSLDRFGRLDRVNASISGGGRPAVVKEYSALSLALMFRAGAMGIPFLPTKALLGTDMLKKLLADGEDTVRMGKDPWTGEDWLYIKACRPDYSIIHANAVDEKGNVIIQGAAWDLDLAKAGKKLMVTAERLVSNEYVKAHPELVSIPGAYTYGAAIVPAGCYPTSIFGELDFDAKAMWYYSRANQEQGLFDALLKEYVYGTSDHFDFIQKIGGLKRLAALRVDSNRSYRIQDLSKPKE
ncbi:MAG: CoA transferase subunit A [Oscillospiraceae bacterium]|nr:CoA transferase subunit A [Oscillospiraceae bacterium]